ncbi:MAG: hypothetical protein H6740_23060 [Alphaproteobacteria bacterium]|nr:hypothetical protein [Alphaproteobacteria bacterium]
MLALTLLLSLPTAIAAEVTELPPWLRGDVNLAYNVDYTTGSLNEVIGAESTTVGRLSSEDHVLRIGAVFAPAPATAIYFDVPIYLRSALTFSDSSEMAFDPLEGRGSMVYGDPLNEQPQLLGKGPGGVWFGVRGTPFSETFFPGRGNRATWLIDLGFRTADSTNFYSEVDGVRGGGNGAGAFRLRSAWSTTKGVSQPYLRATWTRYGAVPVDLYDSKGNLVTSEAQIEPADRVDVLTGVQVRAFENPENGASFDFDFRLGVDYHTPATLPSGLYLPSVLSATEGTLVSQSEYSTATAGLGLYWRMFTYVQLDLRADMAYMLPRRLEHPYAIYTGEDTLGVRGLAQLSVMIR